MLRCIKLVKLFAWEDHFENVLKGSGRYLMINRFNRIKVLLINEFIVIKI